MADKLTQALIAVLVAAVVTSPVACSMHEHKVREAVIRDAIAAGVDPLAATCALEPWGDVCKMHAAKGK